MGQSPVRLLPWLTTPFLLIFFLQLHFFVYSSTTSFSFSSVHDNHLCPDKQSLALFQFKQTLSITIHSDAPRYCDTLYPKTNQWNMSSDCCKWDGVTCNRLTGDVIGLDLSCSQLMGVLHSNSSLFQLPHLQRLSLAFNDFNGSIIPRQFGRFATGLTHLNLSFSNISGVIPKSIFNLTHLTELDLSQNNLEGQIPNGNLLHLKSLSLTNNMIIGPFPSWVANLSKLVYLDLSYNSLRGPLPSNITGLQKLTHLRLLKNSLNGTIPSWVIDLPLLEVLDLGYNQLKGQLGEFQFKSNSFEPTDLIASEPSGFVPQSIFQHVNLHELYVDQNKLSGIVEIEMFSGLKKLETLFLSDNNNLSVRLSTTNNTIINATFPNLKRLGLSSLKIKEFPYFLRAMENLEFLDLSNNQIHGRVPEWGSSKWRDSLNYLNLGFNFLEEPIPSWICDSTSLGSLNLSSNNFGGVLPHCLGNLSDSLSMLDLSTNHFHGTIPSTFANLSNLQILNLHDNQLEGMVPSLGNCTNLYMIDLGSNKLKDAFPRWMETLPLLNYLILRSNEFHGLISISNISQTKYLQVMDLSNNEFRGEIPNVLGTFQFLKDLDLYNNQLQGEVPSSLSNCAELKVLNLGKNKINDTFPNWLGTLPELHVLVLSFNRFHGPINTNSKNKNPFPKLRIIDLSYNEFSGSLPELFFKNFKAMEYVDENKKETEYVGDTRYYQSSVVLVMKGVTMKIARILTSLTTIDMSSNKFEGEIPDVIGNLKFLRQLNLSHNNLIGRIPSLLGNLSVLESLDINSNQLVGEIPQELANLNFLAKLNLSHNHLRGRIPSGTQLNTFSNDSYYGNLALCEFPLSNCGKGEMPQLSVLKEENDSDFMGGFTWEAVLTGYGCGIVLGFVIGYIMFLVGKPKWFTGIVERELRRKVRRPQRRGYKHCGRRN